MAEIDSSISSKIFSPISIALQICYIANRRLSKLDSYKQLFVTFITKYNILSNDYFDSHIDKDLRQFTKTSDAEIANHYHMIKEMNYWRQKKYFKYHYENTVCNVRSLLDKYINFGYDENDSPLIAAARMMMLEVMKFVKSDRSVNSNESYILSRIAIDFNDKEMLTLLNEWGISPQVSERELTNNQDLFENILEFVQSDKLKPSVEKQIVDHNFDKVREIMKGREEDRLELLSEPLRYCMSENDLESVDFILSNYLKVYEKLPSFNFSAVYLSLNWHYDEIFIHLLKTYKDINFDEVYDDKPLFFEAMSNSHSDNTILYIINGIKNINASYYDTTILQRLADHASNYPKSLRRLVERGCDVNLSTKSSLPPLLLAAQRDYETAVFLLKNGANFNSVKTADENIRNQAECYIEDLIDDLFKHHEFDLIKNIVDANDKSKYKLMIKQIAKSFDREDLAEVDFILQNYIKSNEKVSETNSTVFAFAIYNKAHKSVWHIMNNSEIDYDEIVEDYPLIFYAVENKTTDDVVLKMVNQLKDVSLVSHNLSIIQELAKNAPYYDKSFKRLIERGADFRKIPPNSTPTVLLSAQNDYDTTMFLLEKGADFNSLDVNGDNILMCSLMCPGDKMWKYVVEKGVIDSPKSNIYKPIHIAAMHRKCEAIKFFVSKGEAVDVRNQDGITPLMVASDTYVVDTLLGLGAEINGVSKDGRTAMHYAFIKRNHIVAMYLIQKNARHDIRDIYGKTALDYGDGWEFLVEFAKLKKKKKKGSGASRGCAPSSPEDV
ncbi:hypothetical protein TVAG_168800 [Trichomonas vaginalis G3]|uniref:DED domain-containing protein n=1 Tax=Trichomonas vaginalis (strain ATCC PRA-98 / G3) TaxID=412133 RepID=A2FHF4_TRIV3|nr:spectrin binding [Trichomonas vaginalis G3]EAX95671.1 hypothetical protein TVAG_168800 [Trichomonas vaginalis G3]KAI5538173.1 spectrin binding [Trichomonas vaginalis G3]|eukprot:XP_001308601.1 hypothetical protein [Trichomonas vaginalis G3]